VDQQLAIGSRSQLKTRTPEEFVSAIEEVTHCAFPTPHENHIHRESGKSSGSGTRDQCIKQQLCLGGKRTLIEALRQTFRLEVRELSGLPSGCGKQVTGHYEVAGTL
jgi:hypothetical protein